MTIKHVDHPGEMADPINPHDDEPPQLFQNLNFPPAPPLLPSLPRLEGRKSALSRGTLPHPLQKRHKTSQGQTRERLAHFRKEVIQATSWEVNWVQQCWALLESYAPFVPQL